MVSLRDMHERMVAVVSLGERRALLAESERVMSEGVAMLRRMKPGLAVSESGKVISEFVTEADSDAIKDFLGLMELLVQLKDDQNLLMTPASPTQPARPARIQPASPLPVSVKAFS
jgi:hypothetical protein